MLLIEKHGVYIEDRNNQSVGFSNLENLSEYAPEYDFDNLVGYEVTYEPERSLHVWFDGINTIAKSIPDITFESLISSVGVLKSRLDDKLYGLNTSEAYDLAITEKLNELDAYRDNVKNVELYFFTWDDGTQQYVYADEQSIEKMITVCRSLPESSPVLTANGTWKTADISGANNIYVPTTVGELIRMRDEMITRGLHNWSYCDAHKIFLKQQMSATTMTPRQILDYDDYKTNWELS